MVVPKAEIEIVDPNRGEIGTTSTNENGNFWLEKVDANRHGTAGTGRVYVPLSG